MPDRCRVLFAAHGGHTRYLLGLYIFNRKRNTRVLLFLVLRISVYMQNIVHHVYMNKLLFKPSVLRRQVRNLQIKQRQTYKNVIIFNNVRLETVQTHGYLLQVAEPAHAIFDIYDRWRLGRACAIVNTHQVFTARKHKTYAGILEQNIRSLLCKNNYNFIQN